MNVIRRFVSVGQGAFYTETFNFENEKINIVFDCGTLTDKSLICSKIHNEFEKKEVIHALFLSHFHDDHVNGITELMEYCDVKKIYFPYVPIEDRWIVSGYLQIMGCEVGQVLLNNPERIVEGTETRIYGVKDKTTHIEKEEVVATVESGKNQFIEISQNDKGNDVQWYLVPQSCYDSEVARKVIESLAKEYSVDKKDIDEDFLNKKIVEDVGRVKKVYKEQKFDKNSHSLTLFSGCRDEQIRQYPIKEKCICKRKSTMSGCLYMGDYNAKVAFDKLQNNYKDYWEYIGCIQVPHHGSQHNFNSKFVEMECMFVISAGKKNQYDHPHAVVLKSFLRNNITPYLVTEEKDTEFTTLIELVK